MGIILKITFINIFNAIMKNEKKKHGKKTQAPVTERYQLLQLGSSTIDTYYFVSFLLFCLIAVKTYSDCDGNLKQQASLI